MKILVVDDEKDIRDTTAMLLEMHGYDVDVAATWEEGRAQAAGCDAVLQDVRMPGLDLPVQVEALRERGPRVILFTGQNMTDLDAAATGADAFVAKPFNMEQLKAALGD